MNAPIKVLLGVRGELEAALQCTHDTHTRKHLTDALAALDAFESRDLGAIISRAYGDGFKEGRVQQYVHEVLENLAGGDEMPA
jgi:hypothetical protein